MRINFLHPSIRKTKLKELKKINDKCREVRLKNKTMLKRKSFHSLGIDKV